MRKILIPFFFSLPLVLGASEIKEEITSHEKALELAGTPVERGEILLKLACAYYRDQEVDKAFHHFLQALKEAPVKPSLDVGEEEQALYEKALAEYLRGGGGDPFRLAKQMLEHYGEAAESHPEWIQLNFLISTAYGNMGLYDTFFERFYQGYPYLSDTFLAYKTRGILYLRLSKHGRSSEERHAYQEEAFHYLTEALQRNLKDSSLYKVLIFLAKDEKNDALILNYLQKMVEHEAHISRSDIYLYVREAVALGEPAVGQQIIDLARTQYEFSRAISAAQEYLNQCRG